MSDVEFFDLDDAPADGKELIRDNLRAALWRRSLVLPALYLVAALLNVVAAWSRLFTVRAGQAGTGVTVVIVARTSGRTVAELVGADAVRSVTTGPRFAVPLLAVASLLVVLAAQHVVSGSPTRWPLFTVLASVFFAGLEIGLAVAMWLSVKAQHPDDDPHASQVLLIGPSLWLVSIACIAITGAAALSAPFPPRLQRPPLDVRRSQTTGGC